MSKEKQLSTDNIDKGRRRFSKAGVATPILMTLASQPAFGWGGGMQCMSNMMSGNLSDPNRGNCDPGWPPSQWCEPYGRVNMMDTIDAWVKAGLKYGTLKSGEDGSSMDHYELGSYASDISSLNMGVDGTTPLRKIAIGQHGAYAQACLVAYLNASLGINYVFTQKQVIDLCSGALAPPSGVSLEDFFRGSW